MPYKILTYTNPYELNRTEFWPEIKNLPHFCVARTLVNGLVDIMRDDIGGLICPLDDLVSHRLVYKEWADNIARRIEQYSYLTKLFDATKEKSIDPKKEEFFGALNKNKSQFLDALRLFVELGISASSLHSELALKEQKAFVRVLKKIQNEKVELFQFPKTPDLSTLKVAIDELARKEQDDYQKEMTESGHAIDPKHWDWLASVYETTTKSPLTGIVVHGVHQFSPAQIRLLTELEKQGLTVYFLFNYQPKYAGIYGSWLDIYGNFDVPIETDGKDCALVSPENQNESYALATALGLLCEGEYSPANPGMRSSYERYKKCAFWKFSNLTEYANYVAMHVETAKSKRDAKRSALERGVGVESSRGVLGLIEEQVYTANRDIHDLLNVYFPEYSKDRHFLSYPIGQFFAGLYRLWDWEAGAIRFDLPVIRECISSGLLSPPKAELLLKVSYVLEIILERIEVYEGSEDSFISQMDTYLSRFDEVTNAAGQANAAKAKELSIYDPDTITREEIVAFVEAIKKLNGCAIELFGQTYEDFIKFGDHFERLGNFIKQRKAELITEVEEKLINDLLGRFEQVIDMAKDSNGTFDDLRQGLYFYLRQKKTDTRDQWIVKNFEQIDGDILQSKKQHSIHKHKLSNGEKTHKEKVYHFAALSDRDMNVTINDLLPWPLTEQFILKAYSPVDLQFQVYYSSLGERSSFLRYALFYGLYFNQCGVRLSYVEQVQDEIAEPYTLLTILGLEPTTFSFSTEDKLGAQIVPRASALEAVKPTSFNLMSMMLCPHRFLMEAVVEKRPVANSDFLYQKVFENALIEGAWKRCSGKAKREVEKHIERIVEDEATKLRRYFFFWPSIQVLDICRRATNYFVHNILTRGGTGYVESIEGKERHIKIRNHYGMGKYEIDVSEYEPRNPYPAFEAATKKSGRTKEYKLHQFKNGAPVQREYLQDMRQYLSSSIEKKETVVSDWCIYCTYRNVCLDPFLRRE